MLTNLVRSAVFIEHVCLRQNLTINTFMTRDHDLECNSEETRVISQKIKYDKCDPSRHFTVRGTVAFFLLETFHTVPRLKLPRKLSNVDTRRVLRK